MESLVFLVLMFLVGGVLQTLAKRKQQGGRGKARRWVPPIVLSGPEPEAEPKDLLGAIRRAYEQAEGRQPTQRPRVQPPPTRDESLEEMIEESASLEVEPETRSLEVQSVRPERVVVDRDDAIGATIARRLKWAEDHSKPLSPADHRNFDRAIRRPEPSAPVARDPAAVRHEELRRMLVWLEVLGPPKSLR